MATKITSGQPGLHETRHDVMHHIVTGFYRLRPFQQVRSVGLINPRIRFNSGGDGRFTPYTPRGSGQCQGWWKSRMFVILPVTWRCKSVCGDFNT